MTEEELRAALHEHDLGRVVDQLMHLAAPTIRNYPLRANEQDIPIGASKLGGRPDLPDEVSWPAWHEPMAFIAQINLAAAAPYDREQVLPPHGLLSFFYETDGEPLYAERWGLPEDAPYPDDYGLDVSQSWRVLYHGGDPATFRRRGIPPGLNEWVRYTAFATRFALEYTLPDVDGPELQPLGLTEAERNALIDLDQPANWGTRWEDGGHHLLGFPYNLGGPTLVTCDDESRGVRSGWEHAAPADRLRIERDVAEHWRLLLQVSSSDLTGMAWAGWRSALLHHPRRPPGTGLLRSVAEHAVPLTLHAIGRRCDAGKGNATAISVASNSGGQLLTRRIQ